MSMYSLSALSILLLLLLISFYATKRMSSISTHINKKQKLSSLASSSSSLSYNEEVLTLCSWNIDGIRDENLESDSMKELRITIIASILAVERPDIICIQENTFHMHSIIKNTLDKDYIDVEDGGPRIPGYFTSIFIRKEKKYKIEHQRISFAGLAKSEMNRDLNIATITLENERRLVIMTSHLESLSDFEKARKNQLQIALEILIDADADYAILCGDLNIREKEAKEVLSNINKLYVLPKDKKVAIQDAWINLGEDKNSKYTWTGKPFGSPHFNARYDRIYYSNVEGITPTTFRLLGKDTLDDISTTACKEPLEPSDHFGLLCSFKFSSTPKQTKEITKKLTNPLVTP